MSSWFLRSLLAVFLVVSLTPPIWAEEGRWRERIRERIEERRAARDDPDADGQYRLEHAGERRQYRLHLPAKPHGQAAIPLVIALHGGGGNMDHMARDDLYGLISAADRAGYAVVFPNGTSPLPSGKFATWNAGRCCGKARDEGANDVGFIRAVIADITRRHGIDRHRIFAIGMSNGGMMAYRLACEAADLFRGIMAVAGTDNTVTCAPSRPVPVLHIHARDDDHVLFQGGAGANAFRDHSKVTDFTSVPDSIAQWVRHNHATPTARTILSVPGAQCQRHDGPAPVQLCVTDTGGHSWPGGSKSRGSAPSQAIQANAVMWEFFGGL